MTITNHLSPDGQLFVHHNSAVNLASFDFSLESLPAQVQVGASVVVEGVSLTLSTDANAALRRVYLRLMIGAAEVLRWMGQSTQTVLLTERHTFGQADGGTAALDGGHRASMPAILLPTVTDVLRVAVQNVQAGDLILSLSAWGRIEYVPGLSVRA